jgi:hypothetical protein
MAFNSDVITSSYYLSPMFRLFLMFSFTKFNRGEVVTPGIFGTLAGSFTGLPRATKVKIPVRVPETGRYRVLMRAAATANQLTVTSKTLGLRNTLELRSPNDALQMFTKETVYNPKRTPTPTADLSIPQLEKLVPNELIPVNLRYAYQDLGVVTAEAGAHSVSIEKLDNNPLLLEGLLLIPEDAYQAVALPPNVTVVTNANDLNCSERTPVRKGILESSDAVGGKVNEGPTLEQLLELLGGMDDLKTAEPGGTGVPWLHLVATILLALAGAAFVRRHIRRDPDAEAEESDD